MATVAATTRKVIRQGAGDVARWVSHYLSRHPDAKPGELARLLEGAASYIQASERAVVKTGHAGTPRPHLNAQTADSAVRPAKTRLSSAVSHGNNSTAAD